MINMDDDTKKKTHKYHKYKCPYCGWICFRSKPAAKKVHCSICGRLFYVE